MNFRNWLEALRYDAITFDFPLRDLHRSTFARVVNMSDHLLHKIYSEGVRPSVNAIILWVESDEPGAFLEEEVAEEFAA